MRTTLCLLCLLALVATGCSKPQAVTDRHQLPRTVAKAAPAWPVNLLEPTPGYADANHPRISK